MGKMAAEALPPPPQWNLRALGSLLSKWVSKWVTYVNLLGTLGLLIRSRVRLPATVPQGLRTLPRGSTQQCRPPKNRVMSGLQLTWPGSLAN